MPICYSMKRSSPTSNQPWALRNAKSPGSGSDSGPGGRALFSSSFSGRASCPYISMRFGMSSSSSSSSSSSDSSSSSSSDSSDFSASATGAGGARGGAAVGDGAVGDGGGRWEKTLLSWFSCLMNAHWPKHLSAKPNSIETVTGVKKTVEKAPRREVREGTMSEWESPPKCHSKKSCRLVKLSNFWSLCSAATSCCLRTALDK